MLALPDVPFHPPMARTTLTVQLDEELKRRFEALAAELDFELDDLLEQMIQTLLFEHSPESADPDHPETRQRAEDRLAFEQVLRGETVSQEELIRSFEAQWARSGRLPPEEA